MKTKKPRLQLLLRLIDIALVIILFSLILFVFYVIKGKENYASLPSQITNHDQFSKIGTFAILFAYFNAFKAFMIRLLYVFILVAIRKVIKSIMKEGVFEERQVLMVKKIAYYFFGFAALVVFFNLSLILSLYLTGSINSFKWIVGSIRMAVFDSYVLAALIALGMTHLFVEGMHLRKEQDLTI